MSHRLDELVERLAASPTDRSLDRFEAHLGRGREAWTARVRAEAALTPIRFASIVLALAAGVTFGGASAALSGAAVHPADAFSATADLAPSTLLDSKR